MPKNEPQEQPVPVAEEPAAAPATGQIRVTAQVNVADLRAGDTAIVEDSAEWRARVESGLVVLS